MQGSLGSPRGSRGYTDPSSPLLFSLRTGHGSLLSLAPGAPPQHPVPLHSALIVTQGTLVTLSCTSPLECAIYVLRRPDLTEHGGSMWSQEALEESLSHQGKCGDIAQTEQSLKKAMWWGWGDGKSGKTEGTALAKLSYSVDHRKSVHVRPFRTYPKQGNHTWFNLTRIQTIMSLNGDRAYKSRKNKKKLLSTYQVGVRKSGDNINLQRRKQLCRQRWNVFSVLLLFKQSPRPLSVLISESAI